MEDLPQLSCVCLTYGRPAVLEEALHSFLLQDYAGPKELIILNDHEDQVLELDHPEVRVINVPRRFRTVGEKRNAAVALCRHDLIFVWDDDDIYLPHRLSFSVRMLAGRRGLFTSTSAWGWRGGRIEGPTLGVFHSAGCWSRRLFDTAGGYPAMGSGQDRVFEDRVAAACPTAVDEHDVAPEDLYYIYRWNGSGSYHLSGHGGIDAGPNSGHEEVAAFVKMEIESGRVPRGRVRLRPHWRTDYAQRVAERLAAQGSVGS